MSKKERNSSYFHNPLEVIDLADNICLLSHRHSDMQSKINDLVSLSRIFGLAVNIKKTKAMCINSNKQCVDSFCYLGCMMSAAEGNVEVVRFKLGKARSAFWGLNHIWR